MNLTNGAGDEQKRKGGGGGGREFTIEVKPNWSLLLLKNRKEDV